MTKPKLKVVGDKKPSGTQINRARVERALRAFLEERSLDAEVGLASFWKAYAKAVLPGHKRVRPLKKQTASVAELAAYRAWEKSGDYHVFSDEMEKLGNKKNIAMHFARIARASREGQP